MLQTHAHPVPLPQTLDHLFRHESGKIQSVLVRLFGTHHLELVEDAVQDALLRAAEQWGMKGVPANPTGWLIEVAKNRMYDVLRRNAKSIAFARKDSEDSEDEETTLPDQMPLPDEVAANSIEHSKHNIKDDMLAMMFTCCHPSIGTEAQLTLILKILCGFSTAEIAKAFLTGEETIQKRLFRAKELFRKGEVRYVIPSASELPMRLQSVVQAIYLLFNEGYNSTHHDQLIRRDLMAEAFRLCELLSEHPQTSQPEVFALMALICFHAARTESRLDGTANIVLLEHQDRSLWNYALIERGVAYLGRGAEGRTASRFHIEAGIAYQHCVAPSVEETDWKQILALYDMLLQTYPTPVAALNRAVAVAQVHGSEAACAVLQELEAKSLDNYYLYHVLFGDMLHRTGRVSEATFHLQRALSLTHTPAEQRLLEQKLNTLRQ
jgi:RNA polymerase sigma-70 factor (ECF subfamily)